MYGPECTCMKGDFVFKPWLSLEHLSSAAVPALVSGMTLSALILPCRVRLMFLPKPGSAFLWCVPQCGSALGWESKWYQNKTTEGSNVLFCWPVAKKLLLCLVCMREEMPFLGHCTRFSGCRARSTGAYPSPVELRGDHSCWAAQHPTQEVLLWYLQHFHLCSPSSF